MRIGRGDGAGVGDIERILLTEGNGHEGRDTRERMWWGVWVPSIKGAVHPVSPVPGSVYFACLICPDRNLQSVSQRHGEQIPNSTFWCVLVFVALLPQ